MNIVAFSHTVLNEGDALVLPLLAHLRDFQARDWLHVSLGGINEGLARLPVAFRGLRLRNCPAMTPAALQAVTSRLRSLQVLYVTDAVSLTDDCLVPALRHLGRLRKLLLSGCRRLTPQGLWAVRRVLPGLTTLHWRRTLCSAPFQFLPRRDPDVPFILAPDYRGYHDARDCYAGCGWRLTSRDQKDHLQLCRAAWRACPVEGCPYRAPRAAMVNHIPACPHWKVVCYLCGDAVVRSKLGAHCEGHRREDRGRDLVELPRPKWSLPPRDYDTWCPMCGETIRLSQKAEHPCLSRDTRKCPLWSAGYGFGEEWEPEPEQREPVTEQGEQVTEQREPAMEQRETATEQREKVAARNVPSIKDDLDYLFPSFS
jgi:hypothetical protein